MAQVSRAGQEFAAKVGSRTVRMKDYTKRVWQESCIRLVEFMQTPVTAGGHMPVRTGFLRSSLMASTAPIAFGILERPGSGPFFFDMSQVEGVIRGMKVGEKLSLGYLASYAKKVEYGWGDRPGYGFQRLAVQMWPTIVSQVVQEQRAL